MLALIFIPCKKKGLRTVECEGICLSMYHAYSLPIPSIPLPHPPLPSSSLHSTTITLQMRNLMKWPHNKTALSSSR